MLDSLFSQLAPHYCLSCGEIGAQICDNCFYDIDLTPRQNCLKCHGLLWSQQCGSCDDLRAVSQYVLSERDGILERLLNEYKFHYTRASYRSIAELFHRGLPFFSAGTRLVPIPTSSRHIRLRGFDHTRDVTRLLARKRHLDYSPVLTRLHNHAQVGASVAARRRQAASAFGLRSDTASSDALHVVVDDIVTTGASVTAATRLLRAAGVQHIAICALVQQPWKT